MKIKRALQIEIISHPEMVRGVWGKREFNRLKKLLMKKELKLVHYKDGVTIISFENGLKTRFNADTWKFKVIG